MTQPALSDIASLTALIERKQRDLGRPVVVGVSGFAGSGKSTLVRAVIETEPSMLRMRGDDFLDPSRSHRRSSDWDGVS